VIRVWENIIRRALFNALTSYLKLDSDGKLYVLSEHHLKFYRALASSINVDPSSAYTLIDISGRGIIEFLYVNYHGVGSDELSAIVKLDNEIYTSYIANPKAFVDHTNLSEGQESLISNVRLVKYDTTNNIYKTQYRFNAYFYESLNIYFSNTNSSTTAVLDNCICRYYLVVSTAIYKLYLAEYPQNVTSLDIRKLVRDITKQSATIQLLNSTDEEGNPQPQCEIILPKTLKDKVFNELMSKLKELMNIRDYEVIEL